jgi:tRNA 2-thiouridine synthesizing protein B
MLFTVNKSPFMHGSLESCLRVAPAGAPLVLYEDAVYAAAEGTRVAELLRQALARHPVYALEADLQARGIQRVEAGVQVIPYAGFVALVEQHRVVPWL